MEIKNFKSSEPKTPFAPTWNYFIGEGHVGVNDMQYWSEVKTLILNREKEILENTKPTITDNSNTVDGYTGLGDESLTSRFSHFNVLNWPEDLINPIRGCIKHNYLEFLQQLDVKRKKCWVQCWANVMRKGEQIKPHLHSVKPYSYLGGHISVTYNNTSTFYINPVNQINEPEIYESKNEIGKFTIFQNCIPHYTSINESDSERITIAFDYILDEQPDVNKSNLFLVDDIQ